MVNRPRRAVATLVPASWKEAIVLGNLAMCGLLGVGLIILYYGAETLVKGSVSLATSYGISPLMIGLTVVAFGTSTPELSLDLTAALRGTTDLAFGDIIGSNIANIGLIAGLAALVRPMAVQMRLLRFEVPFLIAASVLLWLLTADGLLGRIDCLIMLLMFACYLVVTYRAASREPAVVKDELKELAHNHLPRWKCMLLIIAGLAGLILGSQMMVYAAVAIARQFGISELVIGLTIVAVGTSLPELATSIVGALRGEADIVIGNVIGSNIFNILLVLSSVALVHPIGVHASSWRLEVPVMIGFAIALIPIMSRGRIVDRLEGAGLLACYVGFCVWQAMHSAA